MLRILCMIYRNLVYHVLPTPSCIAYMVELPTVKLFPGGGGLPMWLVDMTQHVRGCESAKLAIRSYVSGK